MVSVAMGPFLHVCVTFNGVWVHLSRVSLAGSYGELTTCKYSACIGDVIRLERRSSEV